MASVNVEVNGRPYSVGCEDGQEGHVTELARGFDAQVREVGAAVGQVGDLRLFLMAALLNADDLSDARGRLGIAQAELARLQSIQAVQDSRVTQAIDAAAARVETFAAGLG